MENPEAQSMPHAPSEALSEHDIHSDENAYEEDELLLLQIADPNIPPSPTLDAVIHKPAGTEWETRPKAASPLLVERPQSSGIDVSAFSFAKPLQQGKTFSIQSTARRASGELKAHSTINPAIEDGIQQPVSAGSGQARKEVSRYRRIVDVGERLLIVQGNAVRGRVVFSAA